MRRSHNQKPNRITYARSSRQNQGPYSALSPLEQQIIAEQRQKREQAAKDAVQAKQRVDGVIII